MGTPTTARSQAHSAVPLPSGEAWSESNLFTLTIAIMAVYFVSILSHHETVMAQIIDKPYS